jgi:hypothetical protein
MPLQPRKRIVVQVETNSRDDLSEVEYELLLGWVERWPGFLKKDAVEESTSQKSSLALAAASLNLVSESSGRIATHEQ